MLLIAGGLPRSGTTTYRHICNAHPEIYLVHELIEPLHRPLLDCMRAVQAAGRKLKAKPSLIQREERMLAEMFFGADRYINSVKRERRHFDKASIYGHKTPRAEVLFGEYEELFGHHEPRYVYCLRDPLDCLSSWVKMPWRLLDEDFDILLDRMRESYRAFLDARARTPDRLFVFRIEEFAADRISVIRKLYDFLGVDSGPAERAAEIEPTNSLPKLRQRENMDIRDRELTEAEIAKVKADPLITEIAERFVWRP